MQKVCVIGLGPMGKRHLTAIEQSDDLEVVAVVERNEQTLHSVSEEYGIAKDKRFHSYEDVVASSKPDIVAIATNGPSHFALFKEIVASGVTMVLCEKPIATSLANAREMEAIAGSSGVQLIINHARRWCRDYIQLKQRLSDGLIGKVESYMFSMGGGQLGCNATHFIDLITYLSDSPIQSVIGFLNDENVPNPRGPQFKDPGGYALMHLENQTRVFFEMTEDLGIPPILVINGTYGRIIIEETKKKYTIEKRPADQQGLPVTRYGTPLSDQATVTIEHLDIIELTKQAYQLFNSGQADESVKHAIQALESVIAIHYSNELSHQAVHLPIQDGNWSNRFFTFT